MAIICDNDMAIILKGSAEEVIRKMLKDRLFALIKMPAKKPEKYTSELSSSVFVGFIGSYNRSFAIRPAGAKTVYEDCEYYLTMYYKRGTGEEENMYFDRSLKRKEDAFISVTYPSADELLSFLNDKELVLITNYMHYGNFENFKAQDFLEDVLFLWDDSESDYIPTNDGCDIRIYLTRADDSTNQDNSFHTKDVRSFDIRRRTVDLLEGISKKYFSRDKYYSALYYSAEFEAQEKEIQAAYFVTRFHSNLKWDADPVNIVIARISAFVLPGAVPPEKIKNLPADKKTKNLVNGAEYLIDSIHFNSDIFYDLTEFEDYLDNYFCYIQYD